MIAVPDAALLPSVPRPMRALELVDQRRAGSRAGNVGNGRSSTRPIISQWPVTESLPGDASAMRPNAPRGDRLGGDPRERRRRAPRPSERSVGTRSGTLRGDVAERVAALVAVRARVGQLADADAVEDDDDDALRRRHGWRRGASGLVCARSSC